MFDSGAGLRPGILRGNEYILDVQAIDDSLSGDLLHLMADADARERLDRIGRGSPPPGTLRRVEKAKLVAPVTPGRVVLTGGLNIDEAPKHVVGPRGGLPAGQWSTGVAAVVSHRTRDFDVESWDSHIAGYVPIHWVDGTIAVGPWIVAREEAAEPRFLAFSAFVDDIPRIRPAKALLDWGAALATANDARTLRAGDLVGLATPPQDPNGQLLRAALVYNGTVAARLEAVSPGAGAGGLTNDEAMPST